MATLHLQLLGDLNITYGTLPVVVKSARLQSLLAFLLLHSSSPQPRQRLAFLFWPGLSEIKARNNLRQTIFDLRHSFPDAECFVDIGDATLQWRRDAPFTLDVLDLQRELANVDTPDMGLRRASLERAAALYTGDLLPACYDDWILPERERLRQRFVQALESLVALLERQGEFHLALGNAQRLLHFDPLREETYCHLMRLASRCGDRTGVTRHYRTCVSTLRRELDVEPSPETRFVYEQSLNKLADDVPTPPVSIGLAAKATNLRPQLNRFVGRARELETVKRLIAEQRWVTLSGPGGVGKTRLASAVAAELDLPHGVWFVNLVPVNDAAALVQAVCSVLNIRQAGKRPLEESLTEFLRDRILLLLLDNCEHLTACVRALVDQWLGAAPGLRLLLTSRAALGHPSEIVFRVLPLTVPAPVASDSPAEISRSDSVQLFCDRARAVLPTCELSTENAHAVASICRQLDGLPLAIELAAVRMNVLSAEQISQRLGDALTFLTRGRPGAVPHQRTLEATLDWSYDLLSTAERVLFRRLAVFAESFRLEAVEYICSASDEPGSAEPCSVLDLLSNLIDKSLVDVLPGASVMRYQLLQVIRQYASDKLGDSGERQVVRARHLDCYLQWVERYEKELRGPRQANWFDEFEREHDNLRTALEYCLENAAEIDKGLRMASALWWFWFAGGHLTEGRAVLSKMLAWSGAQPTTTYARALNTAGFLALFQGDFATAREYAQQAHAIAEPLDDKPAIAMALFILGDDVVAGSVEQSVYIRKQSLAVSEAGGDQWMMAFTLNALGEAVRLQDDYAAARTYYETSLCIRRGLQDKRGIAVCLSNLGVVAYHLQDVLRAKHLFRQVLAIRTELKDVAGVASSLVGTAGAALAENCPESNRNAARWLGTLSAGLAGFRIPLIGPDRREFDSVIARMSARLGDPEIRRAWEEGKQMSLEQAVADALRDDSHGADG